MKVEKLAAGLSLAVLVGVVVHVAAAGFEHAPGGHDAVPLAAGIASVLLASLAVAFGRGAFGTVHRSIATPRELAYATLALGLAGTASYGAIELLEGHIGTAGAVRALAVSFPIAALVLAMFRRARSAALDAGMRLGTLLRRRPQGAGHARFVAHVQTRRFAHRKLQGRPRAGRSPPLFV